MKKLETCLLTIVSAATAFGPALASAASIEVWNGSAWVSDGTSHLTGRVVTTYAGTVFPCNADLTLKVNSGIATLNAISFAGSSVCAGFMFRGLPWSMLIGSASGSSWNVTIGGSSTTTTLGGINYFLPATLNINCPSVSGRASVSGTLINPAGTPPAGSVLAFSGMLGPCGFKSNPQLTANPAVRVVP